MIRHRLVPAFRPLSALGLSALVLPALGLSALVLPALVLSACAGAPPRAAADPAAPVFAPIAFFAGRTEGVGRLKVILSHARTVRVEGRGRVDADGALTLVQHIDQQGSAPRDRRWTLRPAGPGRFACALSEAVGPVTVAVEGSLLRIRFEAKGGLAVEQRLVLQPDRRTVLNHLVVRKFGVRVAVLDETIRKLD